MASLEQLIQNNRCIRVVGFDDSPFSGMSDTSSDAPDTPTAPVKVGVSGVVCANTRIEGMLWGEVSKDGLDATEVLANLLSQSKFAQLVNVALFDGITMAGLNVLDLASFFEQTGIPAVSVMRRPPNMQAFHAALEYAPQTALQRERLARAGVIHPYQYGVFQVVGANPDTIAKTLARLTDIGKVPEALRLAHLIGSAVVRGQSGKRA